MSHQASVPGWLGVRTRCESPERSGRKKLSGDWIACLIEAVILTALMAFSLFMLTSPSHPTLVAFTKDGLYMRAPFRAWRRLGSRAWDNKKRKKKKKKEIKKKNWQQGSFHWGFLPAVSTAALGIVFEPSTRMARDPRDLRGPRNGRCH